MNRTLLTLGHSPDPDDAFMFYALATGKIDTGRWAFKHVMQDIQTRNDRALRGDLDITAISIHTYPYVKHRYALTHCGSSMGDRYGPMVVARTVEAHPNGPHTTQDLRGRLIAVPGEKTTAFLVLNLLLGPGEFQHEVVMFDQILDAVEQGRFDAGLIIHEGQLTYRNHDLDCLVDLGRWWHEQTGLPLPLGGNAIRRDLGPDAMREITAILKRSIEFSLAHRTEAVEYALRFARDMGSDLADKFVGMYVNDWTLDYGDKGRAAVRELLARAHRADLVPHPGDIEFI
jgi:1,4-dihydroxy-6-naphthoate synthase